jgi:protein CWC15
MTTAHRPTWNAAVAGGTTNAGGNFVAQTTKINNRDAASQMLLKTRQLGQSAPAEKVSRKEFLKDLEKKEMKAKNEREGRTEPEAKRRKEERFQAVEDNPFPEDADDAVPSPSEKSEEEEDDEDEDTEELMRELAKIKKEREEEEEKKKLEKKLEDDRSRRDEVMKGNPLVHSADVSLKRQWDDDTVFKNQARTAPKQKLRYINDAVRSDFHKKFLNKYVWVDGTAH